MPEIARLNVNSDWINLDFMKRERTPEQAMKLGIQMHVVGLSLSNTTSVLESMGVERSRKAAHDWVSLESVLDGRIHDKRVNASAFTRHKADLQPDEDMSPDHVAIDETVIRISEKQFWLYAAVDTQNNHLLHVRLFHSTTTIATEMFLRELTEKHEINDSLFLVDGAQHLQTALGRSGLRFRYEKHGNRNSAERVFRELKRRTHAFSNNFSNV